MKTKDLIIAFLCIIAGIAVGASLSILLKSSHRVKPTVFHEHPAITDTTLRGLQSDTYRSLFIRPNLPDRVQGMVVSDAETAVNMAEYILASLFDTPSDVGQRQYTVRKVNGDLWQLEAVDVSDNKFYNILILGQTGAIIKLTQGNQPTGIN